MIGYKGTVNGKEIIIGVDTMPGKGRITPVLAVIEDGHEHCLATFKSTEATFKFRDILKTLFEGQTEKDYPSKWWG